MKTSEPNEPRRIAFLGCPVDCLTSTELLDELARDVRLKSPPRVIQFMNANKVAMVRKDPSMGALLERADYVLADGQPMLPLATLLGMRIPERIDGIGLMRKVLELADREKIPVSVHGAKQEIVETCVEQVERELTGVKVDGFRKGNF